MAGKKPAGGIENYGTGAYWRDRMDLIYYQYFKYFIRCLGPNARSMIDVGSGNVPYLDWFDWIPERVSIDLDYPYESDQVTGIKGNLLETDLGRKFDLVTCMQVLEHVPEVEAFAKRLTEIGDLLLISVPYQWPKGLVKTHVNDPVDLKKVVGWFGREPNYSLVVREPFRKRTGARLFAIYDPDPKRVFDAKIRHQARPPEG